MSERPDQRGFVVASNRGPVSWSVGDDGAHVPKRGAGGLVTALGGVLQDEPGTWVSVALGPADAEVADAHGGGAFTVQVDDHDLRLRLVDVGERLTPYYDVIANRLLWFTLHDLWDAAYAPADAGWSQAFEDAYTPVNRAVADAVVEVAEPGQPVFLQDYHLCLTAPRIRELSPDTPILTYVHTPWPGPDTLRHLPDAIAQRVLAGLLAADVVALSSPRWAEAFRTCAAQVLDARVEGAHVVHGDRRTHVVDLVLGVDQASLQASADDPATQAAAEELVEEADGRQLIVRVDRSDLSKNILRGLQAYEALLDAHPDLVDRVWHYALVSPSRQGVPDYRAYLQACEETAERIATRFGEGAITFLRSDDHPRAVAALQHADVLLTNPVLDGTNLVAKEGAVLNRVDGVLVLSRDAGCAAALADGALLVNPFDVEETAAALHTALTMPAAERARRATSLRRAAVRGDPASWFSAQRHLLAAAVTDR